MATTGSEILRALEELLAELPARARGSRGRVGEQTAGTLRSVIRELGVVTREEFEELELRVAQLEHRLHLVEKDT